MNSPTSTHPSATPKPAANPPTATALEFAVTLVLRDAQEAPVQVQLTAPVPRASARTDVSVTMDAFDRCLREVDTAARVQMNQMLTTRFGPALGTAEPETGTGTEDGVDPELVRLLGPARKDTDAGLLKVTPVEADVATEQRPLEEPKAQEVAPMPEAVPEPGACLLEYQI